MDRMPLATLSVVMVAGEGSLPDPDAGLAVLSGEGLEEGTMKRSGPELAEAFEEIGSSLSIRTGWDATAVSVTCLADRKAEALDLLAETLLQPSFPTSEIERLRDQRLAAIRQRRKDPGQLADDAASHFFYSDSSPYHRSLGGSLESVATFTPEDLREFAGGGYRPSGSGLIVVGDVDPEEVRSLAEGHFGAWEGPGQEGGELDAAPRFADRRIVVVDRPGAVQSEIRIGQVGVPRSTPFFFPLKIFNAILGGAFTSRLMLSLREKHGFTYGVRSRFSMRRGAGPFSISTAVATEVTGPAVQEAVTQLRELLESGPSKKEVERARDYIAGVFPLQLETTGQVAGRIAELQVHDLPEDFFLTYRDRIREVTPEAAVEAGRNHLRLQELVVVVVGDAGSVRPGLEELGFGPIEVVSGI
jgi:zinc protease